MKKLLRIIEIIVLLIILFAASGIIFILNQAEPVTKAEENTSVRIEIPYGITVSKVGQILKSNNLIKNDKLFYYCARLPKLRNYLFPQADNSVPFVLKSGIYYISPNMNIAEIQNLLSSGQQEFIKVSIPEGLTISKIAAILEDNRICNSVDFSNECKNAELLAKYNIPAENFEGFLFPDTYYLTSDMTASSVIEIMVNNFFQKIKTIENFGEKTPEEIFEIITLASIVEREYQIQDEAPLIASVFKNRLRHNIGLYSCATVEYIITEILGLPHPGKILIEDTKIDNPYNTYKWAGLPPGPISNPGLVAINACVNTPKTDYYFFQVSNQSEGRHVFTSTFEEHKVNHK